MQTIDTNGYQKTQYKQFTQTIHTNNSFKTAHCKQFLETAIREFNANSIYQLLSHNSFQTAIRTVIREIITNNSHRLLSDNFYLFIYLFIYLFTSLKTEQLLKGKELQENEAQKD